MVNLLLSGGVTFDSSEGFRLVYIDKIGIIQIAADPFFQILLC